MPQMPRPADRHAPRGGADRGATGAEYAIIVTLVAVVVIGAVTVLGRAVAGLFAVPGGL
jgi:hypothetical protein